MNPINTGEYFSNVNEYSSCMLRHKPISTTCHAVFDAKRLIGRKFSDQIVQNDCKLWPFKVRAGAHDIPEICGKIACLLPNKSVANSDTDIPYL